VTDVEGFPRGLLIPDADAAYLVAVLAYVVESSRRGGALPSQRLVDIHARLEAGTRGNASTRVADGLPAIGLTGAWLSTSEAALLLGISADAVRWHCRRGNLVSRRAGGRVVVSAASVEDMREERSA
jgi:hypothetical protein